MTLVSGVRSPRQQEWRKCCGLERLQGESKGADLDAGRACRGGAAIFALHGRRRRDTLRCLNRQVLLLGLGGGPSPAADNWLSPLLGKHLQHHFIHPPAGANPKLSPLLWRLLVGGPWDLSSQHHRWQPGRKRRRKPWAAMPSWPGGILLPRHRQAQRPYFFTENQFTEENPTRRSLPP